MPRREVPRRVVAQKISHKDQTSTYFEKNNASNSLFGSFKDGMPIIFFYKSNNVFNSKHLSRVPNVTHHGFPPFLHSKTIAQAWELTLTSEEVRIIPKLGLDIKTIIRYYLIQYMYLKNRLS